MRLTHLISGLTLSVRKIVIIIQISTAKKKKKENKKDRKTFAMRISAVFRHLYKQKNIEFIS